ncbi:MAG: hypothetical protein KKD07_09535 [Candidatus Omnitrophica bacterium]|nr:hypothetical protein [Candidatus Omnitrophota bacterium]MBU1996002.1 hypothetical protein [Candidatus Omnitrophota bacterium]MBU4334669.1 hypothetical protein [Candidatus Omnitrophota bacterium]
MKQALKTVFTLLIFVLVCFVFVPHNTFASQGLYKSPKTVFEDDYHFHIPSSLEPSKKYPLVISLTPKADAGINLGLWLNASEKYKWFVYADKRVRSGSDMHLESMRIIRNIKKLIRKYPIDDKKIIAAGFSSGGMMAHALAFESKLISGLVSSCGHISDQYKLQTKKYPKNKKVVLMSGDFDFNYHKIKSDFIYLKNLGWKAYWITSDIGHDFPEQTKLMEAAAWFEDQWAQPDINGERRD